MVALSLVLLLSLLSLLTLLPLVVFVLLGAVVDLESDFFLGTKVMVIWVLCADRKLLFLHEFKCDFLSQFSVTVKISLSLRLEPKNA
jgi:hypothetical protein